MSDAAKKSGQQSKKGSVCAGRNRIKCARYRAEMRREKSQVRRRIRHTLRYPGDTAARKLVLDTPPGLLTKAQRAVVEQLKEASA